MWFPVHAMTAKLEQGKCANVIQQPAGNLYNLFISVGGSTQAGYFQVYDCATPTPPSVVPGLPKIAKSSCFMGFFYHMLGQTPEFLGRPIMQQNQTRPDPLHFVITAIYQQTTQIDLKFR